MTLLASLRRTPCCAQVRTSDLLILALRQFAASDKRTIERERIRTVLKTISTWVGALKLSA